MPKSNENFVRIWDVGADSQQEFRLAVRGVSGSLDLLNNHTSGTGIAGPKGKEHDEQDES